jgi:ubiquinone/menaquinone biosynthesis C-methylase UbiE
MATQDNGEESKKEEESLDTKRLTSQMRTDWDKKAQDNPRYFICTPHWKTEEEFDESGKETASLILGGLKVSSGARVLEIGCGIGRVLKHIAPSFAEAHGIDISEEMIALGKDRLSGFANIYLHLGDGATLNPLPNDYFDLVYSVLAFQHMPAGVVRNYLRECHRVLKPGGELYFQLTEVRTIRRFLHSISKGHVRTALGAFRPLPDDYWKMTGKSPTQKFPTGKPWTMYELKEELTGIGFRDVRFKRRVISPRWWERALLGSPSKLRNSLNVSCEK